VTARRFPPPWAVEDIGGCFVVKASNDRPLVFIYYGEGVARRSLARLLTRDAARRSADRCRARYDDKCDGKQTYLEPSRFFGPSFCSSDSACCAIVRQRCAKIEVRSSKHVVGHFSSVTPTLVGPSPAFVSTVQHHGGSSPKPPIDPHPFSHVLLGRPDLYCIPAACRISSSSRHIFTFVSGASRCRYAVMQAEEQNCMCQ
jgi:hypothetical protein